MAAGHGRAPRDGSAAVEPCRRGRLPSWADYYQLLIVIQKQYEYIVVDLPEVINQATAEFVRNAQAVFIVCQPELASVKLVEMRRIELESCEIPPENVKVLVNRWERRRLPVESVEQAVEGPGVRNLTQQLQRDPEVGSGNATGYLPPAVQQSVRGLAQKTGTLPETPHTHPKFTLLRKLGTVGTVGAQWGRTA